MKIKLLFFVSPLLLFGEISLFSSIVELLRQPSDVAIIVGISLSCIFIIVNYLLINFIIKQLKNKPKK